MEPKYKLKWQLWDWAAKKTFCIKKGTKCPGGRKKWATCNVHLSTFTQSQDKSKLTIQETIPIFAAQAPHVPPESRSYLGTCSVVAAVTQEKRLSYRVSVHCMSVSLLLRFPCSQHTLLKSHTGKRSYGAKELILSAPLCKRCALLYYCSCNFNPFATSPVLQDKHLIQKVCFQTVLPPQQPDWMIYNSLQSPQASHWQQHHWLKN